MPIIFLILLYLNYSLICGLLSDMAEPLLEEPDKDMLILARLLICIILISGTYPILQRVIKRLDEYLEIRD